MASQSTMYCLLAANGAVRERCDQLRRPNDTKPELLATKPNEWWSWDITK
jgi:putative transposase